MPKLQWARLREDINCGLRRGAWYRTVHLGAREVILSVHRQERAFPRNTLEIRARRPSKWTVVPRTPRSMGMPASWGANYAVCPGCRSRHPLAEQQDKIRCKKCNGLFDVAWDESYLKSA